MAQEVELRAKINKQVIEDQLKDLGAEFVSSEQITDYYFGDLLLYEKIGHSFWMRVRERGGTVELAYKGSTGIDGVYEEYEQEVQDVETAIHMLTKMGLENPVTISKQRDKYTLGGVTILLDAITGKGDFLELEVISDSEDKTALYEMMEKLSIPAEDIFEKGYITLFLQEEGSPFSEWIVN